MHEVYEALDLIAKNRDIADFEGPKSAELIDRAQIALGVELPASYCEFLQKLGCGDIAGREFYGVVDDEFEHSSIPDGVWLTLDERKSMGLPHHLIIVYALGDGTYFALDTSRFNEKRECPVVSLPPGANAADELEVVADDYGKFLLQTLKDALT